MSTVTLFGFAFNPLRLEAESRLHLLDAFHCLLAGFKTSNPQFPFVSCLEAEYYPEPSGNAGITSDVAPIRLR
jgi:hypothetical protein